MNKTTNEYVAIYQDALQQGDIQIAYERLIKAVMALKAHFANTLGDQYSFGNVSPGYMDYTYFPFFNAFLRKKRLRFGIVLNHRQMSFELWLMGQNAQVQKEYWELLKSTKWNENQTTMPQYAVLEAMLVEAPDFNDLDALSAQIAACAFPLAAKIVDWIAAAPHSER